MSVRPPLVVDTGPLRRDTGASLTLEKSVVLEDLEITAAHVRDGRVDVALTVENVVEGIIARGRVAAVSEGECRRCLDPVVEQLDLELHEVFELHPTEGETWPIADDLIDLEPVVREAVLLALPLAPLCREDCAGPRPDRFPTGPAAESEGEVQHDPRWAALDGIRFDE